MDNITEQEVRKSLSQGAPDHINRMYLDSAIFSGREIILPNEKMAHRFEKHYGVSSYGYTVTHRKINRPSVLSGFDKENATSINPDNTNVYIPDKKKSFLDNPYHCFVHDENRIVRNGLEAIANKVRSGDSEGVRYVFTGPNESGKSYLAKSVLTKLSKDGLPVSYIDTNDVISAYGKSNGAGGIPEIIKKALSSKMIVLDEANKIHSPGGELRSGTPKGIIYLIDQAKDKGIPLMIFYTGDEKSFAKMSHDLSLRKGDGNKEKLARDLGSRLGTRVAGKIGRLGRKSIEHFVSNYLMNRDDLPSNVVRNIGEVVHAIAKYIPENYGFRKTTGDIDAVLFNASYGGKQNFGAQDVAEVLGFAEQNGVFREGIFFDEVVSSVSDFTDVSAASIRRKGSGKGIPAARAIIAWTLVRNGWKHEEIADCLPISRTTVTNLAGKIEGLLDETLTPEKKNDKLLKSLAIKWKENCPFSL